MAGSAPLLQRGHFVTVTYAGRTRPGMVTLASPNGESLIVMFDGMLGSYVGAMPISWDRAAAQYVDLLTRGPVQVEREDEKRTR